MSILSISSRYRNMLIDPKQGFVQAAQCSVEDISASYIQTLLVSSVFAGVFVVIKALINAAYVYFFEGVSINFWHLLNYFSSIGTGTFFAYVFSGTFGLLVIVLIIGLFVDKKYADIVKVVCVSLSPILVFGWISSQLIIALCLWSAVLLISAFRN